MIVYLDMDGVLADFDGKTIELIGKRLRDFPDSQSGWDAMAPHLDIYGKLDKMPDADDLIDGVVELQEFYPFSIGVLTALPKMLRVPFAEVHKKQWLSRNYPFLLANFNIGPHAVDKQKHCQPYDVLIDDSELNVPQWIAKGGCGILHTDAATSLDQLQKFLEGYYGEAITQG